MKRARSALAVGPLRVGGHVIVADWCSDDFGVDGSVT